VNTPDTLTQFRNSLAEFWNKREAREQKMLSIGTFVVSLLLVYALLVDPALTGRAKLKRELPELHQQVAQMQALSKQVSALAAKPMPVADPVTRERINATLAQYSLAAQNILLTGEYVKVQMAAMPFSDTLAWIDELQKSMRLTVVDADFAALEKADMVDAKLTFRQDRNE